MCVAMPGTVISIENTTAIADFSGNRVPVETGLVDVRVGDHVLVHAGCVIQILSQEEHDSITDLFEELGEIMSEEMGRRAAFGPEGRNV